VIDLTTFLNNIILWASPITSPDRVIKSEQGAPRPDTTNYITVKVTNIGTSGHDFENKPDGAGLKTVGGPRIMLTEFQSFGPSAMVLLDALKTSLNKVETIETLMSDDISILNFNNIQNISVPLETEFEERAILEVNFLIQSEEQDTIPWIDTTNIDAEYKDPSGNVILNSTINI
jgi:hypothetical protein